MSNPHLLNWPEIITLLAALGLMVNACITYLIAQNRSSQRIPARDEARSRKYANAKKRTFHE